MISTLEPRTYLDGWYPGYGEELVFKRLPDRMREFLSDAVQECPEFLDSYLIPTLQSEDPYGVILNDMALGLAALDMEESGLGDFETNLGDLGVLGKSFWKRVTHALKKSLNPVQAIKGAVGFTKREAKKEIKEFKKVEKAVVKGVEKIARKYGPIILTVVGAVLGPFTGGASVAAAAILIAAQKAYQAHAQAAYARKMAKKESGAMQADADAQTAQVQQQVDQFYSPNQSWFETQLGVTPDKWAQLSLQQKIDLINSGTTGQIPPNTTAVSTQPTTTTTTAAPTPGPGPSVPPPDYGPPVTTPSIYGGGGGMPSGGGGGGGGGGGVPSMGPMPSDAGADWGNVPTGSRGAPSGQQAPQIAQESMFGGGMQGLLLPAAIVTVAAMVTQGKGGGKGGSRRSSSRRRRR